MGRSVLKTGNGIAYDLDAFVFEVPVRFGEHRPLVESDSQGIFSGGPAHKPLCTAPENGAEAQGSQEVVTS